VSGDDQRPLRRWGFSIGFIHIRCTVLQVFVDTLVRDSTSLTLPNS
jgi:hypothetical protein